MPSASDALSRAPFTRRRRPAGRDTGLVELACCRSDLCDASSNARLRGRNLCLMAWSCLARSGCHGDWAKDLTGLDGHMVGIEYAALGQHRPEDSGVLVGQGHHGLLPTHAGQQLNQPLRRFGGRSQIYSPKLPGLLGVLACRRCSGADRTPCASGARGGRLIACPTG
jgi:hypothetical protein